MEAYPTLANRNVFITGESYGEGLNEFFCGI